MKHRIGFNRLDRRQAHRKALKNNMVTSLFRYERVVTTKAKALEVRRAAEKMVTRAREDSVHNRRLIGRRIHDQEVLAKLFTEIAPRYMERPGGYTRVIKTGRRQGDAAEMVILELVDRVIEERVRPEKEPAKEREKPAVKEEAVEEKKTEPEPEVETDIETEVVPADSDDTQKGGSEDVASTKTKATTKTATKPKPKTTTKSKTTTAKKAKETADKGPKSSPEQTDKEKKAASEPKRRSAPKQATKSSSGEAIAEKEDATDVAPKSDTKQSE